MLDNDLKLQLKHILWRHKGKNQAITASELCRLIEQPDRTVRLIIRELRSDLFPVLSSGRGYYLPSNRAELDQCVASMKSRLIEDAKTRRDILKAGALYLKPAKQGVLI